MIGNFARLKPPQTRLGRALGSALICGLLIYSASATASSGERALKLYVTNTKEQAIVVFRRNGELVPAGLARINYLLRDWRRDLTTSIDPALLDLLWNIHKQTDSSDYIHVTCGYRSEETNQALRRRSSGVAQNSQHMLGKAIDFHIPDVELKTVREVALRLEGGGVGYYPNSRLPFVHVDTGATRHWPAMTRQQLLAVFPDGGTIHTPQSGEPLPGYDNAVAVNDQRMRFAQMNAIAGNQADAARLLH